MSKYIKLYDAIMAMEEWFSEPITPTKILSDLPTIEVSEEVLKATKKFNAYTIADENAEMGMRTMIEPIVEVSEDNKAYTYCSRCGMRVVVDAPSVVPSRAEGEWIKHDEERDYCSVCKHIFKTRTLTKQDKWTTYVDDLGYNYCPHCGSKMRGAK